MHDCDARFAYAIMHIMISVDHDLPTASPLPSDFVFSQSSLQAFDDCPRRFWLTYVEALPWPALEAAPVREHERMMRLGATFHRLVERAESGIEVNAHGSDFEEPLAQWLTAYLNHRPQDLPVEYLEIEHTLGMPWPLEPTYAMTRTQMGHEKQPDESRQRIWRLILLLGSQV